MTPGSSPVMADLNFSKHIAQLKWPVMPNIAAFLAAHRRNIETLPAANRVALGGAQAVARRHMEIVQQSMVELSDMMQALAAAARARQK
jgi:hypothetical protein